MLDERLIGLKEGPAATIPIPDVTTSRVFALAGAAHAGVL
jgi:hypothetical protein